MEAKSRTLMFILVSFVLGIVAGGFIGVSYFGERRNQRPAHSDVMKEFTQKLKLQGEQPVRIDSLLEANRKQFGELRKSYSDVFRQRRDSLRKSIRIILSSEQNLLYDQYIKEMDEREARYRRENK